jgi:hypothetical protein
MTKGGRCFHEEWAIGRMETAGPRIRSDGRIGFSFVIPSGG